MPEQTLDLSNVIDVSILSAITGLGLPNVNTAALFSKETPVGGWSGGQAYKIYTNATAVATDFGSSSNAAKIAAAFFSQQPNPLNTNGYLVIIKRTDLGGGSFEDVEDAIARTLNSVYYFGVLVDEELADDKALDLATYMQTIDKLLFYGTPTAADYAASGLFDDIRAASLTHARCLFYDGDAAIDTQRMAAAYCARTLSTDFAGSNTAQTMHLKSLAGITPDTTIDQTKLTACQAAGVDVYVSVAGVSSVFTSGTNGFVDEVYNELAFKFALQVAGFNYLRQTSTKIPQTEPGLEGLKNEFRKVCQQYVTNGFIAPGSWTSPDTFGDPAALLRNVAEIGYYVYSQPITAQAQVDREARKAPAVQIAIKSKGAIHRSNVTVKVNL